MIDLRKFLGIVTVALVIILTIVIWFMPSNDDFQGENLSWNGIADICESSPVTPLKSLSSLPPTPKGATLILIPYLDFTPEEMEGLREFAASGGTIILADDYGYGNKVLEYMKIKAKFSGNTLLDPLLNYRNQNFPRILKFKTSALTNGVESLTLNHATCLEDVGSGKVLAWSSSFSFLDLNENEAQEEGEPVGPMPVISRHNFGEGEVILIADPSLFINSMQVMDDNGALIENIVKNSPSDILLDQSHLPASNLQHTKHTLAIVHDAFRTPAGTLILVTLLLAVTLIPIWHERRQN